MIHEIEEKDLVAKRPGTGIAPGEINYLIGRTLKNDIDEDVLFQWNDML